jgi:putative acetyltransferase
VAREPSEPDRGGSVALMARDDVMQDAVRVEPRDPRVMALLDELTAELALSGYTPEQTFGYSIEKLEQSNVHLVGVAVAGRLVGVGGLELQGDVGELKRFFVSPAHRGTGVADAVLAALLDVARDHDVAVVRLETGDKQQAAIAFYRRHGFAEIARFGAYVNSETSVCMERRLEPS